MTKCSSDCLLNTSEMISIGIHSHLLSSLQQSSSSSSSSSLFSQFTSPFQIIHKFRTFCRIYAVYESLVIIACTNRRHLFMVRSIFSSSDSRRCCSKVCRVIISSFILLVSCNFFCCVSNFSACFSNAAT
jgi:hypothetical protein